MTVYIVEIVAFLIIVAVIVRYLVPPARRILRNQQDLIAQQMQDADEAKTKLAEAEQKLQEALNEARTESAQIRENARAEAQRTIEDQQAKARDEYHRIVARGEEQLQSQRASIVRELRAEIGTLAIELSEQIVDQRLADEAQVSATVDAFLAGIEDAAKGTKEASSS